MKFSPQPTHRQHTTDERSLSLSHVPRTMNARVLLMYVTTLACATLARGEASLSQRAAHAPELRASAACPDFDPRTIKLVRGEPCVRTLRALV